MCVSCESTILSISFQAITNYTAVTIAPTVVNTQGIMPKVDTSRASGDATYLRRSHRLPSLVAVSYNGQIGSVYSHQS